MDLSCGEIRKCKQTNFHFDFVSGDSIFSAGKPAILSSTSLIRPGLTVNGSTIAGRRHQGSSMTSSSSTISSVSNNNERDKESKELIRNRSKDVQQDSLQQRFLIDSGDCEYFVCENYNSMQANSPADMEGEPPPEPAPPEVPPRAHSLQTKSSIKTRPVILTIDKNGDQKHEEYIPQNQQGLFSAHFT